MNGYNIMKSKVFHNYNCDCNCSYKYNKIVILLFTCLFVIMFFNNEAFASAYNITNYDKTIVVNSNNTFDVTVNMTIRPLDSQLSFDYIVPTRTNSGNKILLNDINVKNANYKRENQRNYSVIKIIDDKSITTKTYTITYKLNFGEDYVENSDGIHINILPNDLESTVSNLSFSMIMPFDYTQNNIELTIFNSDNDTSQKLDIMTDVKYTYNKKSRVFSATCNRKLNYREGLRLDLALPEGYFVNERNNSITTTIILIISIITLIVLVLYFFTIGRDEEILCGKSSKLVNYMSPAYAIILLRNLKDIKLKDEGRTNIYEIVIPMLLYWANKGYITIKENCVNNLNGDKNMIVTKVINSDNGNIPIYERILLDGIFKLGRDNTIDFKILKNEVINNDEVYKQKKSEFIEYIKAFKEQLNDVVYKSLEIGVNKGLDMAYNILRYVPVIILNIINMILTIQDYTVIFDLTYPLVYLTLSIILINMSKKYNDNYTLYSITSMVGLFIIGFGIKMQVVPYILISMTTFLHIIVRKHNFDLMNQLKQIYAFKRFIKVNDRKMLVDALSTSDLYFYETIPFAMTLGLKDKWINNCNDFRVKTPDWYIKNEISKKNLYVQNIDKFIEEFTDFGEFLYTNIYNK